MLQQYLEKNYIQSLLIGVISTIVFKLLHKKNKDTKKSPVDWISLLKVFVSTTLAALIVLYTRSRFPKMCGGAGKNLNLEIQDIMTGKPAF